MSNEHQHEGVQYRSSIRVNRDQVGEPMTLNGEEGYRFTAEFSNNRVDSYGTVMGDSSLENYRKDANTGVSILDSHNYRTVGIGTTLNGNIEEVSANIKRLTGDLFIIDDKSTPQGSFSNTSELISAIRAGTARDMSIGFYDGYERCNSCDNIIEFWYCPECQGFSGMKIVDKEKDKVRTFTTTIEDARLAEVSVVFDGATPGAKIYRSILDLQKRVKLPEEALEGLSSQFNVRFKNSGELVLPEDFHKKIYTFNNPKRSSKQMNEPKADATVEELRELNTELRGELETHISEKEELESRVATLEEEAEANKDEDYPAEIERLEREVQEEKQRADQNDTKATQFDAVLSRMLDDAEWAYREYIAVEDEEKVLAKRKSLERSGDLEHIHDMTENWTDIVRSRRKGKKGKEQEQEKQNDPVEKPVDYRSFRM